MKRKVAFTAGYETFTFLAGLIILKNYDKWMADSHPVMKALWVWHQVEEVEHGSVAHDVYRALYGKHEWYRKYMVLIAGCILRGKRLKPMPIWRALRVAEKPTQSHRRNGFCFKTGADGVADLPVFSKTTIRAIIRWLPANRIRWPLHGGDTMPKAAMCSTLIAMRWRKSCSFNRYLNLGDKMENYQKT